VIKSMITFELGVTQSASQLQLSLTEYFLLFLHLRKNSSAASRALASSSRRV